MSDLARILATMPGGWDVNIHALDYEDGRRELHVSLNAPGFVHFYDETIDGGWNPTAGPDDLLVRIGEAFSHLSFSSNLPE